MSRRRRLQDDWFNRVLTVLDERELASNVLVASRSYRTCNIVLALLTSPVGFFVGIYAWNAKCDAPFALLLLFSALLPMIMALFLVMLIRAESGWDAQSKMSYVIGGLYFGVRVIAEIYFWSASSTCTTELYYGSLFYVILDAINLLESLCMFNSRFLKYTARMMKVSLPEDNSPSISSRELEFDDGIDPDRDSGSEEEDDESMLQ